MASVELSVVIPTYNRARYLKKAIDSVLAQTYRDFEIIVVDDSSTDDTKEIVESYKGRVRYIFQENKERGAARNNGILNSKGEYIALLDSDDMWLPDHLQACLNAIGSEPEAGLSFSGSYIINEEDSIISKIALRRFRGYVLREIVSRYSSGGCNASSCLIRRDIFDKAGYFSEERALSGSEDWEMWARIAACTKLVSTNAYTAMVRFHSQKSSINADRMAKSMTKALDLVFENPELSPDIKGLKRKAYSSLYTVIAINYYASGDMKTARKYLKTGFMTYPFSALTNRYLSYTYLRSLLGSRLSYGIRKAKWALGDRFLK